MTTLEAIRRTIAPDLDRLNQLIARQLDTDNKLMNNVIDAYLRTKGKQIRPIIVLLSARMFGEIDERVLAASASVELLHNASLIHDDVVDNSRTRRGLPTINSIWDNHIAVLVGDFFVSSSMQLAISTGNIHIIDALCHLGKLLSLGELDQIYNARYHTLTEEGYYKIINYKTASLFVACARMGCYAVDVDDGRMERLSEFAELLGMCFQIRDDIFDYYSDSAVGKPTGNDLREGKITLPLLHVLLDESLPHHGEMLEMSRREMLTDSEIDELLAYARDNGGIDYAFEAMHGLRERARRIMESFPQSEVRDSFMALFDYIIERKL